MIEHLSHHAVEFERLPDAALARLAEQRGRLQQRTGLVWEEHCTECVWPSCYSTCEFYAPRPDDLRCRRFHDGIATSSEHPGFIRVRFKRWGKLFAWGDLQLRRPARVRRMERLADCGASLLRKVPLSFDRRRRFLAGAASWLPGARAPRQAPAVSGRPTGFWVECINPGTSSAALSIAIGPQAGHGRAAYRRRFEVEPGAHLEEISIVEIESIVDLSRPFYVELIPEDLREEGPLYFGLLEFVEAKPREVEAPIKCVVWDLDETLWEGTLLEVGAEGLKPHREIIDTIDGLDRRGILHSVASKNAPEEALAVLRQLGVADYFLHPQISFGPKSRAIDEIASRLGIATDSLAFVDDSPFERAEVREAHPEVAVFEPAQALALQGHPRCAAPASAAAAERRRFYQREMQRVEERQHHGSDEESFLRSCRLSATLSPLDAGSLPRVHELLQRTNQLNFSGNRYGREALRAVLDAAHLEAWVIDCEDRFGSYGTVGFALLDRREQRLTDLVFSCRVQGRRIEHAVLGHLLRRHHAAGGRRFSANLRATERNARGARVFEDLGFVLEGEREGVRSLVWSGATGPGDEGIVELGEGGGGNA